jgi:hypothetical protein
MKTSLAARLPVRVAAGDLVAGLTALIFCAAFGSSKHLVTAQPPG